MRPYAYDSRMMMVMCDGKHFRAGDSRVKRVALFFIDDATRYVLDVAVGSSESTSLFLRGLYSVVSRFGLMDALYMDRGPGFFSDDSKAVMASLELPFIYGRKGYPEGRGKIERFNGTVTQDLLRGLQKPTIDPSYESLELRLRHYIHNRYNTRFNEGVEGVPQVLFTNDPKPLNIPDHDELTKSFILTDYRKVRRDNVILNDSIAYEVPLGYAGRYIQIFRCLLSDQIFMRHKDVSIKLQPADLAANTRNRSPHIRESRSNQPKPITTAAELDFNRSFSPIVDHDGGYPVNK